jgi:hypothetical protein
MKEYLKQHFRNKRYHEKKAQKKTSATQGSKDPSPGPSNTAAAQGSKTVAIKSKGKHAPRPSTIKYNIAYDDYSNFGTSDEEEQES